MRSFSYHLVCNLLKFTGCIVLIYRLKFNIFLLTGSFKPMDMQWSGDKKSRFTQLIIFSFPADAEFQPSYRSSQIQPQTLSFYCAHLEINAALLHAPDVNQSPDFHSDPDRRRMVGGTVARVPKESDETILVNDKWPPKATKQLKSIQELTIFCMSESPKSLSWSNQTKGSKWWPSQILRRISSSFSHSRRRLEKELIKLLKQVRELVRKKFVKGNVRAL